MALDRETLRFAQRLARERTGSVYDRLCDQDDTLAREGFPRISPWWHERLCRFYGGKFVRLCVRAGRRSGKSSTICRIAVAEVLHNAWPVTPGDKGTFVFLSVSTGEAEERLDTVVAILEALGYRKEVDFHRGQDRKGVYIRLLDRPLWFRALPANFRTAVGFTCIGLACDELARWLDEKTGRNPASHVLASVRPAMLTMLKHGAKEFLISSPWSELDAHYDAFEKGDNEDQLTAYAPTWQANPTLTENDCRRMAAEQAEGGQDVDFDREYRALPMTASAEALFDSAALANAVSAYEPGVRPLVAGMYLTAGTDFGFASDHSAIAVCARAGGKYILHDWLQRRPAAGVPLKPSSVVADFAKLAHRYGISGVMADGHYRESILEHLQDHGLDLIDAPTNEDVAAPFLRFKSLLHQGRVELPNDAGLLRDLKRVLGKPMPNGRVRIILPRGRAGHADLVSALMIAVWQRGGYLVSETLCNNPLLQMAEEMRLRSRQQLKQEPENPITLQTEEWEDPLDNAFAEWSA